MARQGTSPWVYVGCGCGGCVFLVVAAMVMTALFGVSLFEGFVTDMKDPEVRGTRAKEILGTAELPSDYQARLFVRIPFFVDVVILTDGPRDEGVEDIDDLEPLGSEHLGDHAFLYLSFRGDIDDRDFDEMFSGSNRSRNRVDFDAHFESDEVLSEGGFDLERGELRYTVHRGVLVTEDRRRVDGLYSVMRIDCPDDSRTRAALWFEKIHGEAGGAAVELSGTPGDEDTLRRFMGQFNVCVG